MNVEDGSRMDWDTSIRSSQPNGGETGKSVLVKVLIGIAITVAALPVLGLGLFLLACVAAGVTSGA